MIHLVKFMIQTYKGNIYSVMVKMFNCIILVSEFYIHSRYWVRFRQIFLGKVIIPFSLLW